MQPSTLGMASRMTGSLSQAGAIRVFCGTARTSGWSSAVKRPRAYTRFFPTRHGGIRDVRRNMKPVRVSRARRCRSADMAVNKTAVTVFNHAAIQRAGTLVRLNPSLGMNARVNGWKGENRIPDSSFQVDHKFLQTRCLVLPLDRVMRFLSWSTGIGS